MQDFKKILPGLLISVLLIAVILTRFDVKGTIESFIGASYTLLFCVFLLGFLWLFVRMLVWRTLLKDRPDKKTTFITLMEGYLLNNVLPFRMGEIGRAALLSQKTEIKFVEALSTILIERITDLAFSALILIAAVPFIRGAGDAGQVGGIVMGLVVIFFLLIFFSIRYQQKILALLRSVLAKYPKALAMANDLIEKLLLGLDIFSDPKVFFRFIFWMTLNWGIAVFQYFLLVKAFFPQAQVVWGMFALGAAAFGGAIPSLPGGVGTLEGAMAGALVLLTTDYSASLAVPLFSRLINYFYSALFGLYGLSTEGRSLKGLYQSLRNINSEKNSQQ